MPDAPAPDPSPRRPLWRRLLKWFAIATGSVLLLVLLLAGGLFWAWKSGRLLPHMILLGARFGGQEGVALLERPWPRTNTPPAAVAPEDVPGLLTSADGVETAGQFFRTTNIWPVHLRFTRRQWADLQPRTVPAVADFNPPGGRMILRNPNSQRSGIAGVLGLDFEWSQGRLELGGRDFGDTAVRFKGNGTYLGALAGFKRPFRFDLARGGQDRRFAGRSSFSLNNLNADWSAVSDTLAYEAFREAGVPAPRTAYARVTLSIEGQFEGRPMGLYVMPESIDAAFAAERFGTRETALFKPVTYELFADLGPDWAPYDEIYDPKGGITDAQKARLIEAARLVTHGSDTEFAERFGELFDLDECARFLAVLAWIASYDGFLLNGQNFHMYLDPRTERFGFIPWDLDRAWGEFPFVGTAEMREQASIDRPWVADHRFLERAMSVPAFRETYRRHLRTFHETLFRPERLFGKIDQLAARVRPVIGDEADFRIDRFERAVSATWEEGPRDGSAMDPRRPVHQIKRFIAARHASVSAQLDGTSRGQEFPVRDLPK